MKDPQWCKIAEQCAKIAETIYKRMHPTPRNRIEVENAGHIIAREIRALPKLTAAGGERSEVRTADILRILQASSCFSDGAICRMLPCACAETLATFGAAQAQTGCETDHVDWDAMAERRLGQSPAEHGRHIPQTSPAPGCDSGSHSAQEAVDCGKVRELLAPFYKTVDVMKSARNSKTNMNIWADDMKAVEDVMLFLESLRDWASSVPSAHCEGGE